MADAAAHPRPSAHPAAGGTRVLLRNRSFLALCCAYGTYLLAYNQLYLALPDEVQCATGSQTALSWLFALSSLLVVCAQLPLTRWAGDRLGLRRSMIAGLLLIAAGFGVVAENSFFRSRWRWVRVLRGTPASTVALVCCSAHGVGCFRVIPVRS
ncbi:MFS transporter [Nonomuraea sp. B19D2]|uniref:MFS transporter n=1 Tax=Nonomuraea sp. B19D2 TaxID=3159561 RepID=UPI0032DA0880